MKKEIIEKQHLLHAHTAYYNKTSNYKVILSILFLYFEIQNNLIFTIIFYSAEALTS